MGALDLTSYKPSPGVTGDANQVRNGFTAIEAVVNALSDTNWTGTGANGLDLNKLKNYPADGSKFAAGDGTWKSAGAVVATSIAGLGAGVAGAYGVLRVPPATTNNGGGTALPAATITVKSTLGFATGGTLTTANGTITYTGKTATTFIGCTGGAGTLAAGALIQQLAATSGLASWAVIGLIYDSVIGKWVSPTVRPPAVTGWNLEANSVSGSYLLADATSVDLAELLPWRSFDAAGLKPRGRVTYLHGHTAGRTIYGSVGYRGLDVGDTAPADASTGVSVMIDTDHEVSVAGPLVVGPNPGQWGNLLGGYTVKDFIELGLAVKETGGSQNYVGRWEYRWAG